MDNSKIVSILLYVVFTFLSIRQCVSMRKKCHVAGVKLQEDLDLQKLSGIWYDVARLPQHKDQIQVTSGTLHLIVLSDGTLNAQYTGKNGGKCMDPLSASGHQVKDSRLYLRFYDIDHGFLRGPFWIIESDYNNYALIYGCSKVKTDGTCHKHHELVYIVSRTKGLAPSVERRLNYIVAHYLCVNPHRLVYTDHKYECPIEASLQEKWEMLADSPQHDVNDNIIKLVEDEECQFSSISVHEDFKPENIEGLWYILATHRKGSDSSVDNITSVSLYLRLTEQGSFKSYYTAAKNGKCFGRTFLGVLKKYSDQHTSVFYADYGKLKGPLKFTYFTKDLQYSISYLCSGERLDGSCELTYVDVMGRSTEFPETVRVELREQLTKLCTQPGEFVEIEHSVTCNLDIEEENTCKPSNVQFARNIDWKTLQGYWYSTAFYRGDDRPSLTWYIDLWAYTAFRMHRQYARDGQCTKRETFIVNFDGAGGRLFYTDNGQTHVMHTLFLDGNTIAILYECEKTLEDGEVCPPNSVVLHFLTRSRIIYVHQIETFKSTLKDLCIRVDQIQLVSQAVNCDPAPREAMYYDRCVVKDIPVVENLDINKFSGHWHSLAVSKYGRQLDTIELDIKNNKDNSLTVWYSGVKDDQCVATSRFELKPNGSSTNADYTAIYGRFEGRVKIVHTDYENYALVYECDKVGEDGKCTEGYDVVEIFGRNHIEPTQEVINIGSDILSKICFKLEDVKLTRSPISCHPIKEAETCQVTDMPTQKGFSIKQFLGTWYRISVSQGRNHIESVQLHVSLNSANEMSIAMAFAINGTCQPGKTMLGILSRSNPAILHMKYGKYVGTSVVSYLDDDFAVLYHCTRVLADGTCAPLRHYVSVLARTNLMKTLDHKKKASMMSTMIPKLCTNPAEMETAIHTVSCIPMINHGSCKIGSLPVLKEFDIQRFLGIWYPIVKLKGSQTLDGSIIKFKQGNDGLVHVFFTGVGPVQNRCVPTMKGVLSKVSDKGAEIFISYGETSGRIRIVFTNYEIALMYTCDHETEGGYCYAGQTSVDILSRTRDPNPELKSPLLRRTRDLCIDPNDMVDVDQSIVCDLAPEKDCTVHEIPVSEKITSSRIMGTWYSAARVRGSDIWESGVLHLAIKKEPNVYVQAKYSGSRRGHCLPTRELALYPTNNTGILHVGYPGNTKVIKIVAYREFYKYALFYQCNQQLPSGRCAPGQSYIDIMSRDRQPLPQTVLDQFAEISYKYMCHERSEFIVTSQKVRCDISQSRICKVKDIPTQKYIDKVQLLGNWYAYSQLRTSMFAPAARKFIVTTSPHDDNKYIVHMAESMSGKCMPTIQAELFPHASIPSKGTLVQNGYKADFLVLYADKTHLLYYECFRKRQDGTCFPEDVGLELLVKDGEVADEETIELIKKVISDACYDIQDFNPITHNVPCEVQEETPQVCDMSNLPIQHDVDLGKLLGRWYNVARLPGSGEWTSGIAEIDVLPGTDMVRIHYAVAVRGNCLPTLAVLWIPSGKGHAEWSLVIAGIYGYAAVIYLDDNTLVVYECDHVLANNQCDEVNTHIDVYSRTQEPLDPDTTTRLERIAALMCLRIEYFEQVTHDVTCNVDHDAFIDCTPDSLPIVKDYDLELATGTSYAVMRLKGSGIINSHQVRMTKAEHNGYDLHIVGSRKASCLPEIHGHLQPRRNDAADALFSTNTMSVTIRTMYYSPNYAVHYECGSYLKNGKCTPGSVGVTIYSRSTEIPDDGFKEIWPILQGGCLNLKKSDFEFVPHGVSCELHGEDDDEYCDYNMIQAQAEFDATKFTGTWYHIYRLRNSPQKYDSEVNYVDIMPNGKMRSYSTYFNDGRCSSTKTSLYKPTKNQGEWWFGSFGGIKIVYTDYQIAVIYLCMQSHYDDSCFVRDSEIEVLSRTTEPLTADLDAKLKAALRSICLETGDFVKTNHEVTCNVKKIHCNIQDLPEQPDFNMEMFTGTWYPIARIRNTLHSDGDVFRIAKSETADQPGVYTMVHRMVFNDMCTEPLSSDWTQTGAATFIHKTNKRTGVFKVLYTDYNSAIVYICYELYNATTCLPGDETVYVLSHDPSIEDQKLSAVIENVQEKCFSKRSFEWVPRSGHCPINPKICAISDLPAETSFNVTNFAGVWYGMHQVRGHGDWQNGAVRYEVIDGKDLKITATGTRNDMCLDPSTLVSQQQSTVWEWNVIVGAGNSMVRILDTSDLGDDHAVVYDCEKILPDGTCDPDYTFLDILSRKITPFPEENRVHMRSVIRQACLEPGDFVDANHNVNCELTKVPDIPCKADNLPTAEQFNLQKYSGDWFVIAKLNTSSTPDSTRMRIYYHSNNTVTIYMTGYRARRGCTPTYSTSLNIKDDNTAIWYTNNTLQKILWTDYNIAMVYTCLNTQEDGSCVYGFEHVLILSRTPHRLHEQQIVSIGALGMDSCLNRYNFRWINQQVPCNLELPFRENCAIEQLPIVANFSDTLYLGHWYMRYTLRRDRMWQNAKISFKKTEAGNYKAVFALTLGGHCIQGYSYGYLTDTPGDMISRMSESLGVLRTFYIDKNYLLSYQCALKDKQGYCLESEEGLALFTRNLDPLPDNMIQWIAEKSNRECYEPGDFIPVTHAVNCDNTDWSTPITCVMPDLPIQENFDFDKMTGTWYAVATHQNNPVFPSSALRIEKLSDKDYQIYYTSFGAKGKCRLVDTASVEVNPYRYPGEYEIMYESMRGRMKIVYTDYHYALVYKCMRVTESGYCEKGEDFLIVYSRYADLPDDAIQRMISISELSCTSHEQFTLVPHPVPCVLRSPKLKTVHCKMRNIPAQDNFDMKKFAGTWYSHYKLPSKWKTLVQRYHQDQSGNVTLYYTGEYKGRCYPERSAAMNLDSGGRAIFYGETASTKVVYTDYHYAVVTSCENVLPDGTCSDTRRYMMILSRCLKPIPEKKLERLMAAVREACYEPGDLVFTSHNVNCDLQRRLPCDVTRYLVNQKDFKITQFTGTWHEVARLRGGKYTESEIMHISEYETGRYSMSVVNTRSGFCLETKKYFLEPRNADDYTAANFTLVNIYNQVLGFVRILYTDYDKALMYICMDTPHLDNCPMADLRVIALSRDTGLSSTDMRQMFEATGQMCFQEDQFYWAEITAKCQIEVSNSCKYRNYPISRNFDINLVTGLWYTRYHLRGVPVLDSESFYIQLLDDGNIKVLHTGAVSDEHCLDHTNAYVHQKTDNPAVYIAGIENGHIRAENKFLYVDSDNLVMLFCGKILADGSCMDGYLRFQVLNRSPSLPIKDDHMTDLIHVVKSICFETGQMTESYQTGQCNTTVMAIISCDMTYMASQKNIQDFNMEKFCGTWYPVAKIRGNYMSDNQAFRTEYKDGYYETYAVSELSGDCVTSRGWKVNVSDTGFIETYTEDWSQLIGLSKVMYWSSNGDHVILYHCSKPLDYDRNCMPGYIVVTIMSRIPKMPSNEDLNELFSHISGCFTMDDMEPVIQNAGCPLKSEITSECQTLNIHGKADLLYGDMMGKWHIHYTLRQGKQLGQVQFGLAYFTIIDKTHFKGEFSFKVNGECTSVDTVYHANDNDPGELFINIGSFKVSIKVLYQDDNYMVFYECETILSDGSCNPSGHFVIIFGRSPDTPSADDIELLRSVVRKVCLEGGDFMTIPTDGECEIKIDRREIGCSLTKLPVQKDYLAHKETGEWFAVATLKGSSYPTSLHEVALIDYENRKYTFYSSGKRGRGGCTTTVKKDVPFQIPGKSAAKATITTNNHTGLWQVLYCDYRYCMLYRCSNLLSEDLCAPGQYYVTMFSRKLEKIPMYVIDRMLWDVSPACFTWEDFEWLDLEEPCKLDYEKPDCRVRNIPTTENFDLKRFLGTWYSRYLLVRNTAYDSFAARYEMSDNGTLVLYHNGVSGGSCRRIQRQEFTVPDTSRGVFTWGENKRKVSKVIWNDYNYAVVYTCDKVEENDFCAHDNIFIDVIGRNLNPLEPHIIENIKHLLNSFCSTPGDFVESDHTLQCDDKSCTIGSVVTQRDFNAQMVFGSWQLIARTTHIDTERGPTTIEIMMGKNGNARFAMARNHVDGCKHHEVFMPVENDGTFYYTEGVLPGLFKIIYSDSEYLLLYECFGAQPVGDFCPEENQEIQLWGRKHFLQESVLDRAIKIARERTCVSMSNFMRVPQNIACTVQKSCNFDDLVEQEHYDSRAILGTWQLIAKSKYFDPIFETGTMKLAYTGERDGIYSYAGELLGSAECVNHSGRIISVTDKPAVYHMTYKSIESVGKFLYVDNENYVLLECWTDFVNDICPMNKTAIYIFGKTYDISNDKREHLLKQIRQRTFGCYDTKQIHIVRENTCDVDDPYGRMSCKVKDVRTYDYFKADSLNGLWFLVARSDLLHFKWDGGVIYFTENEDNINMIYTGLKLIGRRECLKVFDVNNTLEVADSGKVLALSYVQGGFKTSAKILYIDEDIFIWYECHGNKVTANGDCQKDNEHVDIYSRRKKINTAQTNKVLTIISDKTCLNPDGILHANHTEVCHLPGVTDVQPFGGGPTSCQLQHVPVQKDFNLTKFSGLWYEVERTRYSTQNTWESSLTVFEVKDDQTLQLRHAGTEGGDCKGPVIATAKTGRGDKLADMKLYVGTEDVAGSPWILHFVYKVVYTDYNTAITYACKFLKLDGSCDSRGLQIDILSRSKELSPEEKSRLHEIISQSLCVDIHDFVKPAHQDECHDLVGVKPPELRHPDPMMCAIPMCADLCIHGYMKDDQGCDTCQCVLPSDESSGEPNGENAVPLINPIIITCVVPDCSEQCLHGFLEVDGCKTCTCQDAPVELIELPCPPVECDLQCDHGYKLDINGCTQCICQEEKADEEKEAVTEEKNYMCPIPMCSDYCPNGYIYNDSGCMTCQCKDGEENEVFEDAGVVNGENNEGILEKISKWFK